ncbi:MAG: XdhC family protein, partial [Rectinemataceae bacterium]
LIGSVSKRNGIYAALRAEGFSDADFARVHCPVGLAIGARNPEEIAVSIMAEIIAHRSGALLQQ